MAHSVESSISEINLEPHQFPYYGVPTRYEDEQRFMQFVEDHHINCDSPRFKFCPHTNIDELKELITNNESAVLDMPSGTGQTRLLQEMRNFCSKTRTCISLSSELLSTSNWEKVSDNQLGIIEWVGKLIITGLLSKDVPVFLPTLVGSISKREKQLLSWFNRIIRTVCSLANSRECIWVFMDEPKLTIDQSDWFLHIKRCLEVLEKFEKLGLRFLIVCGNIKDVENKKLIKQPIFPKSVILPLLKERSDFVTKNLKAELRINDDLSRDYIDEFDIVYLKKILNALQENVRKIVTDALSNNGNSLSSTSSIPNITQATIIALDKYNKGDYSRSIPKIFSYDDPAETLGGGMFLFDDYILTALHIIAKNPTSYSEEMKNIQKRLNNIGVMFRGSEEYVIDPVYPTFIGDGRYEPPDLDVALLKLRKGGSPYKKRKSMDFNTDPPIRVKKSLAIVQETGLIPSPFGHVSIVDENKKWFYHTISAKPGCSGDPIIGDDGVVIALHIAEDNNGFKAISIGAIFNHLRLISDSDPQQYKDLKEFINKLDDNEKTRVVKRR